jgi:hypothetical protein
MLSPHFAFPTWLMLSFCGSLWIVSPIVALSCPNGARLTVETLPQRREVRCILTGSGKRHGPFQTWYNNGNLKLEGTYRYGLPQGSWTYYYPNAQKRMEGSWRFGKTHGPWMYWHPSGSRESTGRFLGGKRDGRWTYWDEAGEVRFEGTWTDGELNLETAHSSAADYEGESCQHLPTCRIRTLAQGEYSSDLKLRRSCPASRAGAPCSGARSRNRVLTTGCRASITSTACSAG